MQGSPMQGSAQPMGNKPTTPEQAPAAAAGFDDFDDDIPF